MTENNKEEIFLLKDLEPGDVFRLADDKNPRIRHGSWRVCSWGMDDDLLGYKNQVICMHDAESDLVQLNNDLEVILIK